MMLRQPLTPKLKDVDSERVRAAHEAKIVELQKLPFAGATYITGVTLPNSAAVKVPHPLGRTPSFAFPGFVSGAVSAGYINLLATDANYLTLIASGFGATITLTIGVL